MPGCHWRWWRGLERWVRIGFHLRVMLCINKNGRVRPTTNFLIPTTNFLIPTTNFLFATTNFLFATTIFFFYNKFFAHDSKFRASYTFAKVERDYVWRGMYIVRYVHPRRYRVFLAGWKTLDCGLPPLNILKYVASWKEKNIFVKHSS
jgi:hypothetical protein